MHVIPQSYIIIIIIIIIIILLLLENAIALGK